MNRIPALDGIRACAIILVVICHVQVFLHPLSGRLANFCTEVAWSGVYLFFVLSGYLIGRLALSEVVSTGDLNVRAFWARRALRTWPIYYLALFANYWFVSHEAAPAPTLWTFLTFTQTFFKMNYFIESWTLSVEELFYLIFPILLFAILRLPGRSRIGILCLLVMAVTFLVRYRTGYWLHPFATFDSLFLGVLIAHLEITRNRFFRILSSVPSLTLMSGILLLILLFTFAGPRSINQFQGVLAIGFGLILIAVLNPFSFFARLLSARVLKVIALSSYSTYLSHMFFIRGLVWAHLDHTEPGTITARVWFFVASIATLGFGWVVYVIIEKPALRLREILVPRHGSPGPIDVSMHMEPPLESLNLASEERR